jgi:hypothetical protein
MAPPPHHGRAPIGGAPGHRPRALAAGLAGALALWSGVALAQGAGAPLLAPQDANLELRVRPPPRTETVAVLILSGEESGVPLSEVYTAARSAIERHTALSVAPLDAIGLAVREAAVRDCAGKADCFARRVRGQGAGLLLTISVDRVGGVDEGLLLGLRLVDVDAEQEIGATGDEIPAGMSMVGAMEQQMPDVFPRTLWDQIGNLVVATDPLNAEVSLGGRSCASPCDLKRMVPGTYEVTIRKSGYIDWKGTVTVLAQQTVTLQQTLQEPEASIVSSPWLWGGVGLAAIGVGVAAFFLLRSDDRLVNVCVAKDPADCSGMP